MWICAPAGGRGPLQSVIDACAETAMSEPIFCLADLTRDFAGLRVPANWNVVPALGPVSLQLAVKIALKVNPGASAYGLLPAGHLPRTRGWDVALTAAAGRWNVAYCNDLVDGGRDPVTGVDKPTGAVCLGAGLVDAMGGLMPPGMGLDEARTAWITMGRALGLLRYLPKVVVENELAGRRESPKPRAQRAEDDELARARLFRWLNDEARPMIRRIRRTISHEARLDQAIAV